MEPASPLRHDTDVIDVRRAPITDLLPFGMIVADSMGIAFHANRAWRELTGQQDPAWRGHGWFDVLRAEHRDDARRQLLADLRSGVTHATDWLTTDPTDSSRLRALHIEVAPDLDGDALIGMVLVATDVTDERARVRQLVDQATHDGLTGLYNRAQLLEFVRHALDRQRRDPARLSTVFFIDVDDLKATNDELGHGAGDRLLREAASRIVAAVRPTDIVARYGGDEFAVLSEDLGDIGEANAIAERIRTHVGRNGHGVSVSIGYAIAGRPDLDPSSLIERADHAMYEAKRTASRNGHRTGGQLLAHRAPPVSDGALDTMTMAAHELRTPLTTMAGWATTLRESRAVMSEEAVDGALEAIERHTVRLQKTLDQLLDLGKARHLATLRGAAIDVADVIADALEISPVPDGVTVSVRIEELQPLRTLADPSALTRVVVNLLTNAYHHGGPNVTIEARLVGGCVEVAVEDDGPGVPEHVASVLFEPFSRGIRNGQSQPSGSGLGLAIAREVVIASGGVLHHEPVHPHGARLLMELPAAV